MYTVVQDGPVWQVVKGERIVCILLTKREAENLAYALRMLNNAKNQAVQNTGSLVVGRGG